MIDFNKKCVNSTELQNRIKERESARQIVLSYAIRKSDYTFHPLFWIVDTLRQMQSNMPNLAPHQMAEEKAKAESIAESMHTHAGKPVKIYIGLHQPSENNLRFEEDHYITGVDQYLRSKKYQMNDVLGLPVYDAIMNRDSAYEIVLGAKPIVEEPPEVQIVNVSVLMDIDNTEILFAPSENDKIGEVVKTVKTSRVGGVILPISATLGENGHSLDMVNAVLFEEPVFIPFGDLRKGFTAENSKHAAAPN